MRHNKNFMGRLPKTKAKALIRKLAVEYKPTNVSWEDPFTGDVYRLTFEVKKSDVVTMTDGSLWRRIKIPKGGRPKKVKEC